MTPPAATAAGARPKPKRAASSPPHGRTVRRGGGRDRVKAPRRVSGPLRSGAVTAPRRVTAPHAVPLGHRALAFVRALPDHTLLDRIVRGRTWIVLLFVLLAGIVAMQVEMLKLNTSIGRSIELGTALQGRNELLRESVSSLSSTQRIEQLATNMGMMMPAPTAVDFLSSGQASARRAAGAIQAPDPSSFESSLQNNEATAASGTAQ